MSTKVIHLLSQDEVYVIEQDEEGKERLVHVPKPKPRKRKKVKA